MSTALWVGTAAAAAALMASALGAPVSDGTAAHLTQDACPQTETCPEWFSPVKTPAPKPAIQAKIGGAVGVAPPGSGVRYYEGNQDNPLRGTP